MSNFGNVILFGSGEATESGRKTLRKFFFKTKKKYSIAILETPAGFQPNSHLVAQEIADTFKFSLGEFIKDISVVSARKKDTEYSPDNESILPPIESSDVIFLGPGSPTYTINQLINSKCLEIIQKKFTQGSTLVLSSAAAIAFGKHALPVYEIYKVGQDLHWQKGLNFFEQAGLSISVIPHWNNTDGGKDLDTSRCFMGANRFTQLLQMLPKDQTLFGIDEHTALIFDFQKNSFIVEGKGCVTFVKNKNSTIFSNGKEYLLEDIKRL
jgi:cyanophycinase-like exopeptidase